MPPLAKRSLREVTMRVLRFALCIFGSLSLLPTSSAQSEPVKIRNAFAVPVANWAPMLEAKKDLAKHWGQSYVMEAVRYQGTPPMITALANNELEIANLAYSTLGLAIQNAGLDDLRIVADEFQDGVPGYYSSEFFVGKDSGINSIKDLKGKVLAVNASGSGVDIGMRITLKKNGLDDKRDFTIIEAPFPTMPAILSEKKADLVAGVMPFSLNPALRQNGKVLFEQKDGLGRSQFIFWVMRKSFIEKHRAAVVDFMEDVLRIERWYLDPKNHDEVAKIASGFLKVPPERFGWLFAKQDYYRDPNGLPDLAALQRNVDAAADLGVFKPGLVVSNYADLSIVKEAGARLK